MALSKISTYVVLVDRIEKAADLRSPLAHQYRGFRIPAGTTIFVNNWGMFHDPEVYDRPEDFWPDRWITSEFRTKAGVDDSDRRNNIWFGSGRRFCPGVHLATNSLVCELVRAWNVTLTVRT